MDTGVIDSAIAAIEETRAQLREIRIAGERRLGMETAEQRERRRAEDLARERMEVEVFSGHPSPEGRLAGYKRHNFAARKLKG
jgi:hypothetical protein